MCPSFKRATNSHLKTPPVCARTFVKTKCLFLSAMFPKLVFEWRKLPTLGPWSLPILFRRVNVCAWRCARRARYCPPMEGGSKLHHHVGMFALPGTLQREKRVCTSVLSSLFILVAHFYANSRKVRAAVAMDMQNASFTDQSKGEEFQWVTRRF